MAAGGRGKYNGNGFQTPLEKKDFKNRPGQKREKQHALVLIYEH